MKTNSRGFKLSIIASTFIFSSALLGQERIETENPDPVGAYFNLGLLGDFAIDGYDSDVTNREARLVYQVEIGGQFFAVPVSFSRNQNVDIVGIKPRFQYLIPWGSSVFSAGPGLGMVYNYWRSSFDVLGNDFTVSAHELGVQPSLQVMIRPLPFLNILITPIAMDINFWREVNADSDIEGLGNFSTTNKDLGYVYSGGASVGFSF